MLTMSFGSVQAMSNNAKRLKNALHSMSDYIYNARNKNAWKWTYSQSGQADTFEKAKKTNNRVMDCARFLSWGLIKIGVFKPGQKFYKKENGNITYNSLDAQKRMHKYAIVKNIESKNLTVKQAIHRGLIKAGDIICYNSHVNLYAGNSYFYDGGSTFTKNGKYKSILYGKISKYMNSEKVTRVIRLK